MNLPSENDNSNECVSLKKHSNRVGREEAAMSFPVRGHRVVAESLKRLQPARYVDSHIEGCDIKDLLPATEVQRTGFTGMKMHNRPAAVQSLMAAREMTNHQIKAVKRNLTSLQRHRRKFTSSTSVLPDVRKISDREQSSSVFLRNWDMKVF